MFTGFFIRPAAEEDLPAIRNLFTDTIRQVNKPDYPPEQIAVWSNAGHKEDRWAAVFRKQFFLVACREAAITGFASMTRDAYLDFLYVHHYFQRMGIASILLQTLEKKAREQHCSVMETHASITALPFFKKKGFLILEQQTRWVETLPLINFRMKKELTG